MRLFFASASEEVWKILNFPGRFHPNEIKGDRGFRILFLPRKPGKRGPSHFPPAVLCDAFQGVNDSGAVRLYLHKTDDSIFRTHHEVGLCKTVMHVMRKGCHAETFQVFFGFFFGRMTECARAFRFRFRFPHPCRCPPAPGPAL